jgi:hypothetical protein
MAFVATNIPYHSFNSRDGVRSPNLTRRLQAGCRVCKEGINELGRSNRAVENGFRAQKQLNIHYARNRVDSFLIKLRQGVSAILREAAISSSTLKTNRVTQIYYVRYNTS